jgi:GNAT superfamily N-acetyltransferase
MSRQTTVIRRAAESEIPGIEAVSVAAYAQYRDEVPAPVFDAYVDDLRRLADHWCEAEVLVAEVDGRIAGGVLYYSDASADDMGLPRGWAGFRKLAVHPQWRGRGLGRALAEACIAAARGRAAPAVGIYTTSFMRAARRVYEQMGFRRCPEFDVSTSDVGLGDGAHDVSLLAYRLDLKPFRDGEPQ